MSFVTVSLALGLVCAVLEAAACVSGMEPARDPLAEAQPRGGVVAPPDRNVAAALATAEPAPAPVSTPVEVAGLVPSPAPTLTLAAP